MTTDNNEHREEQSLRRETLPGFSKRRSRLTNLSQLLFDKYKGYQQALHIQASKSPFISYTQTPDGLKTGSVKEDRKEECRYVNKNSSFKALS